MDMNANYQQKNTTTKHLKTNKFMQQDKTWILIPMLLYTKYSNGNIEFCFGWLRKVLSIKFSIKFNNK
jgi:hypothetical protein